MRIRGVAVDNLVEVEEASFRYSFLSKNLDASATFRVICWKPRGAQGNDSWLEGDAGWWVRLNGLAEILRIYEVGGY